MSEPRDIHAYLAEFEDIPGTRVFTAQRARSFPVGRGSRPRTFASSARHAATSEATPLTARATSRTASQGLPSRGTTAQRSVPR